MRIEFDGYIDALFGLYGVGALCHETANMVTDETPPAAFEFPDGTAAVLTYNDGHGAIDYFDNINEAIAGLH